MFESERERLSKFSGEVLSKGQTAKILGINSVLVDILIKRKLIDCYKIDRYRLFTKQAILAFIEALEDSAKDDFSFLYKGLKPGPINKHRSVSETSPHKGPKRGI